MRPFWLALAAPLFLVQTTALAQPWEPVGPGPFAAFVAVGPGKTGPLLAGTVDGLFTSRDGGDTWTLRTRGLPSPNSALCLVQAAAFGRRPKGRPYVGIGNRVSSSRGCGAFQGTVNGQRWRSLGLDAENVSALAVAPGRRDTLWAGTAGDGDDFAGAVLKKVGGAPWQTALPFTDVDTDVTALAVDPRDAATVYAATNNEGILKTTDGGTIWNAVNDGLPRFDGSGAPSPSGAFILAIPLMIDPHDPDTLHVGTLGFGSCCPTDVGVGGDVFTSHDGGGSWTPSTSGLADLNVLALASHPSVAGTLWAGTTNGVFRSEDGGATWTPFGLQGTTVWSLAVVGDGTRLYAAAVSVFRLTLDP